MSFVLASLAVFFSVYALIRFDIAVEALAEEIKDLEEQVRELAR